jgi:hypothetical protein
MKKYIIIGIVWLGLLVNSCGLGNDEHRVAPDGVLEFTVNPGYLNTSSDSFVLSLKLEVNNLYGSKSDFKEFNYSDSTVFTMGDFLSRGADGAEPSETFYHNTRIPNKKSGYYDIKFHRPGGKDSARISYFDSMFVIKPMTWNIAFKRDTIYRTFPNTYWANVHNCNCSDTVRIYEVDQGMKAAGCVPLKLTPGDYYFYTVGSDSLGRRPGYSNCSCQEVLVYTFEGNPQKIGDYYKKFRAYYDWKVYLSITGWDGWYAR